MQRLREARTMHGHYGEDGRALRRTVAALFAQGRLLRRLGEPRNAADAVPAASPPHPKEMRADGYAGVNIGIGGPPSLGTHFSFTSCPIFSAAKSQSTKLVIIDGPSSSVT